MNILTADLLAAAGPFMAHVLNELPPDVRKKIDDGVGDGSWCELRIGVMNEAASIRLMLVNAYGAVAEIGKVDHIP